MAATLRSIEAINHEAGMDYRPRPCTVRLTVFKPERNYDIYPDTSMGWSGLARAGLEIVALPMGPHAMLAVQFVKQLAAAMRTRLEEVWERPAGK